MFIFMGRVDDEVAENQWGHRENREGEKGIEETKPELQVIRKSKKDRVRQRRPWSKGQCWQREDESKTGSVGGSPTWWSGHHLKPQHH